jgi:hypothetical protein
VKSAQRGELDHWHKANGGGAECDSNGVDEIDLPDNLCQTQQGQSAGEEGGAEHHGRSHADAVHENAAKHSGWRVDEHRR